MRTINKYKLRATTGTRAEKWGVNERARVEEKEILISGTGRSGSKTMALWFKKNGVDVKHELTGEVGTSTHFFHSDSDWYPMFPWYKERAHVGERLSDYSFNNHYHIVRNPLTCIPSIGKIFGSIDFEFLEDLDMMPRKISKLQRCMWAYYSINKKLEEQVGKRNRFHLERIDKIAPIIYKDTGIDLQAGNLPHSNKGSGFRRSTATCWTMLRSEDFELANNIQKMARRFGYDV